MIGSTGISWYDEKKERTLLMNELLLFVFAYLLGNVLTGQIIAKFFYGKKLHIEGSGNVGARNAGRVFGKTAFVLTFLGDAGKGGIVILVSRYFDFSPSVQLAALLFVVGGHIFPILFRFNGGKGASTFIGGFLTFHPLLFILFICVFLGFYFWLKSFTMAGMVAVGSYPIVMLLVPYPIVEVAWSACISVLVLFAHRQTIKEHLQKKR